MVQATSLRNWRRHAVAITSSFLVGWLALTSCSSPTPDSATSSPAVTPTPLCSAGADDQPTTISRLTLDGVTADTFETTLTVPFDGVAGGPFDRPSVVRAAVVTTESAAPVTFRADTGGFITSLDDEWLDAPSEVTVRSMNDGAQCSASVYLFSTQTGPLTLSVESAGVLSTTLDVVTDSSAARSLEVIVSDTEVVTGEDINIEVSATDAFGNPVSGSPIVVSVPREAPARYPNGSHRATVLTDDNGRAEVRLLTSTMRTRTFNVRVRGVDPRCGSLNQYGCNRNEPFIGADDPISDVREAVTVVRPPAPDEEEGPSPRSVRQ